MKTYKARKAVTSHLGRLDASQFERCPHCNPLPGDEIIGFGANTEHLTLHKRACPEAIRLASHYGNNIHEAELPESPGCLYPVRIIVRAIDRYHLLSDLIYCITEKLKLSMKTINSDSVDNIVSCNIDFSVHSSGELSTVIKSIKEIEDVDEVIEVQKK